jgi:hypothetical protein
MAWGGGWEEYEENTRNVKRTIARTVQKSWGRGIPEILRFLSKGGGEKDIGIQGEEKTRKRV